MTDLDSDIERRLREVLHAVIPHLLDADADDAARPGVRSSRARRVRVLAAAAAVALVALTVGSLATSRRHVEVVGTAPPQETATPVSVADEPTSTTSTTATIDPAQRPPDADLFLPTVLPDGFDAGAASYIARTDAAATPGFWTRLFVGTGDRPPVLLVIGGSEPSSPVGEIQDMTARSSWPSYRLAVAGPSGAALLASGGLAKQQLRALGDVDFAAQQPVTLPDGLTEVPYDQAPDTTYAVTWNGPSDRSVTVNVGSSHGVDALSNGITWPIEVRDTPTGQIFVSVDESDATFVQVGHVVDDHVVNVEARNLTVDEAVAVAESIAPTTPDVWAGIVPPDRTPATPLPPMGGTLPQRFSDRLGALADTDGPVASQHGDITVSLRRSGESDGCVDLTFGGTPTSRSCPTCG